MTAEGLRLRGLEKKMVLMPKGQSSDKSFSEDPMQRTRRKKQKRVSTVQKKDGNSLQKKKQTRKLKMKALPFTHMSTVIG